MKIEVNTDSHVAGSEGLTHHVKAVVEDTLARFADRVTWVEVHLGDENSHKAGGAWCGIHAKLAGLDTVNVDAQADVIHLAVDSAAEKLLKVIDRVTSKKEHPRGRVPAHGKSAL